MLEKTIQSIISQTAFEHVEYIIVDGGSKDNTVDIIRQYGPYISNWISEKDKGLYDAMNKAIDLATGNYLWFVNAGDLIEAQDTLEKIIKNCTPDADIYYGETDEFTEDGELIGKRRLSAPENLDWKSFSMGMLVCHQSIIIKKEIADHYDLRYKLVADIDWVIKALKKSKTIVNTHLVLSKFAKGGISQQNLKRSLKERFVLLKRHYGLPLTLFNHIRIIFRFLGYYLRNGRM